MPISPASTTFTLLLSLLVALPSFGIDMSLPALGATGAALGAGSIQMAVGAVSSGLVAILYNGHSALSMTFFMFLCSLLAVVSYVMVARAAEPAVSLS